MSDNNSNLNSEESALIDSSTISTTESAQSAASSGATIHQVPTVLALIPAANANPVVDFLSSAKRHLRDGKYLEANGYVENAGQLYGFVAECGLKALFVLHGGYPVDSSGSPRQENPNLRKHIDGIIPLLQSLDGFCSGRTSQYLSMLPNIQYFQDWSVHHRYYCSASIPQSLDKWKQGADEVANMLEQATMDGVLQ